MMITRGPGKQSIWHRKLRKMTGLYPLRFEPILKRAIWGNRHLGDLLGKALPAEGNDFAESWEVSDHGEDISRVADGPLAGQSLGELIELDRRGLLGVVSLPGGRFPLLVKYLDARAVLSVQVHPDDQTARELGEERGKTECWIILHAEPGSLIYAGLRPGVDRVRFVEGLESGSIEGLLHSFEALPGDCVFIPAGTVHAIGAGVVLAEIQQMSDVTYRLYDWGRVGQDGLPRALHLREALRSICFESGPVQPARPVEHRAAWGRRERLTACPYFEIDRLRLEKGGAPVGESGRFTILLGEAGRASVFWREEAYGLGLGQTLFLPAALGECVIEPEGDREASVITCTAPTN